MAKFKLDEIDHQILDLLIDNTRTAFTDIAKKLTDLDNELDSTQVQRLKSAADIKLKLIGKYLGDVKAIELSGDGGGDLVIKVADFKNS